MYKELSKLSIIKTIKSENGQKTRTGILHKRTHIAASGS
jgi:hypothetical protein